MQKVINNDIFKEEKKDQEESIIRLKLQAQERKYIVWLSLFLI
jgi:hypothetical protein